MEDKQIKAVCDCPKPQLIQDNKIFLEFANFY